MQENEACQFFVKLMQRQKLKEMCVWGMQEREKRRELSLTWLFKARGAKDIHKHVKVIHMKSTHRMTSTAIYIPLK